MSDCFCLGTLGEFESSQNDARRLEMPFSETVAGTLAGDELQDSASSVLPRGFWPLAREAAKRVYVADSI